MLQVLVGLFTSNRDGEDALQALQALGLSPEHGHLYQENRHDPGPPLPFETPLLELHSERAEYAAHGEYLDVSGAANRFSAETDRAAPGTDGGSPASSSPTQRTLLVIEDIGGLRPATACAVLFDHGALAVKDPSGHWRFSPHRDIGVKQGQSKRNNQERSPRVPPIPFSATRGRCCFFCFRSERMANVLLVEDDANVYALGTMLVLQAPRTNGLEDAFVKEGL